MRGWVLLLLFGILLTACEEKSEPDPGDPLPNAIAGMEAIYAGDFTAMNTYVCKEIIISLRGSVAEQQAQLGGRIDLSQTQFTVAQELKDDLLYIRVTGDYAIWTGQAAQVYSTNDVGAILLLMEARDGKWQICDIQSEGVPLPATEESSQ